MEWNKPLPQPTPLSQPYWDGLRQHQVRVQRCGDCSHWIFFPRAHCPSCGSRNLSWQAVSGLATLYTWTAARVPTLPEFGDEMPQLLAVVELDEGPRINTTLVGVQPDKLRVGLRMRPVFDERPGSVTLLRYTVADSAHPAVIEAGPRPAAASAPPVPATPARRIDVKDLAGLQALVSDAFSDWSNEVEVTQELIDRFADLSGDDYWLHTDPAKARARSPFGTTIAHGALVQVLASRMCIPLAWEITGYTNMVNYGSDRLRFPAPVPSGSRVRARSRVKAVQQVKSGVQLTLEIHTHIVGHDRPSVINDLVVLYM
jgi:hypothetical protein